MLLHRFMQSEQADSYLEAINLIVAGQLGYLAAESEIEAMESPAFSDSAQSLELGWQEEGAISQPPWGL